MTDKSRKLCTINTHKGLFSYTRFPYEIKSAPVIFENIMEQFVFPGEVCFLGDILVTEKSDIELFERLESVFQKLQECGLRVQKNKCLFFQDSVTYLGHQIDKHGLHTTEERI